MANKTDISKLEKLQRKALRIVYNVNYRADTRSLFHDICTLPISDLIEREVLKIMHNIYSYKIPKEFASYWSTSTNTCENGYSLRFRYIIRFELPLVKSIRVSQLPLFKFAEIFNNFPKEFKWLPERRVFLLCLEEHYHQEYKLH